MALVQITADGFANTERPEGADIPEFFAGAEPFVISEGVKSDLYDGDAGDMFAFSLDAPTDIQFNLYGDGQGDGALSDRVYFYLYDAKEEQIFRTYVTPSHHEVRNDLSPGDYYLKVRGRYLYRVISGIIGGLTALLYVCLSVAQAWRGNDLTSVPMGDGDLWSCTIMLLVIGSGLLIGSLWRGSRAMRLIANSVLILVITKVFLVDAPDLDGLVWAGSFLALGLVLAGLAWVNRRASVRQEGEAKD